MNEPLLNDRVELLENKIVELQAICQRLARNQSFPQFVTVEEVCEMFTVKRNTVDGWVSAGIVPYRKAGGKTLFMLSELVDWTMPENRKLRKVG